MRITKQIYGTVRNTTGILLGIYGSNRQEVSEAMNRLFNYGVTDTVPDENRTATAKRGLTDSSDSVGIWSDTFAVVLTDERRLKNHLTLEAIQALPSLETFKGKFGGAIETVRPEVLKAFEAIESERILSTTGLEYSAIGLSVPYACVEQEKDPITDELDILTSAARSSGQEKANRQTNQENTKIQYEHGDEFDAAFTCGNGGQVVWR